MIKTILSHAVNLVKHVVHKVSTKSARSSSWAKTEKLFLQDHSRCAACGSVKRLNVHHIKPFHLHPELELDPNNFITLCMDNDCHLLIGHGGNFKAYNPNVVADTEFVAAGKGDLKPLLEVVATRAKAQRVFE